MHKKCSILFKLKNLYIYDPNFATMNYSPNFDKSKIKFKYGNQKQRAGGQR